jgi:alkaline phosphatase D
MTHKSTALCVIALLSCILRAGVVQGLSGPADARPPSHLDRADLRLAFGSCSRHDKPQSVWGAVRGVKPDAFVWLGDVIYADDKVNGTRTYAGHEKHRNAFLTQSAHPEYAALVRESKIVGTWDDHDFGFNNAGAEWSEKPFAKQVFLDFLGEPSDSPRRDRAGVYAHHTFRNLGRRRNRSARLILLDTRFHQRFDKGELLGEDQWRWFEEAMFGGERVSKAFARRTPEGGVGGGAAPRAGYFEPFIESEQDVSPVDVTIIGSSIQVHAETQRLVDGVFSGVESWNEFPEEKKRLMDVIERSKRRVVFLSGDVHHAEIITSPARCVLPYELVEITSSGMTHGILDEVPQTLSFRTIVGWLVPSFLPRWLWPDVGGLQRQRFIQRNWGEVAIDFGDGEDEEEALEGDGRRPNGVAAKSPSPASSNSVPSKNAAREESVSGSLALNIRGDDGVVKISKRVRLSSLEGTWEEIDAAALRGELEHGAAEGRLRRACRTEKDLTRLEKLRLPALAAVCLLGQPAAAAFCVWRLVRGATRTLRKEKPEKPKRKEA